MKKFVNEKWQMAKPINSVGSFDKNANSNIPEQDKAFVKENVFEALKIAVMKL